MDPWDYLQTGPLSYIVQLNNGLKWKRHVDHLKLQDNAKTEKLDSEPQSSAVHTESAMDGFPLSASNENRGDEPSGSKGTVSLSEAVTSTPEVETSPRYPSCIRHALDRYNILLLLLCDM